MRWINNKNLVGAIRKIIWNRMQRTACLFVATISCTAAIHSTTLIVIRRERQITIAADSRTAYGIGGAPVEICKIERLSGGVFFASSGLVLDTRTDGGFSATAIALNGKPGAIAFRAAAFAEAIKGPLLQSAHWARQHAPEAAYREFFGGNNAVILNAIFIGMENRVASVREVDFTKIEDAQGNPVRIDIATRACPSSCGDATQPLIISMGQNDAVRSEINSLVTRPGGFFANDAETARRLVETEIAARPDKVGPPISIVQINNSGARWINEGVCGQSNKP
jgi:hypothetical protein